MTILQWRWRWQWFNETACRSQSFVTWFHLPTLQTSTLPPQFSTVIIILMRMFRKRISMRMMMMIVMMMIMIMICSPWPFLADSPSSSSSSWGSWWQRRQCHWVVPMRSMINLTIWVKNLKIGLELNILTGIPLLYYRNNDPFPVHLLFTQIGFITASQSQSTN